MATLSDEEIIYQLQLQIQSHQIDQQRRKDEVAAQFNNYENQIKHLFVSLNTLSKRIWVLINSKSYLKHYDILQFQPDYQKIQVGEVFQKITNYLLTPKMDINAMLRLCNNNDKCLQLSNFVYLLSLFCYLYSHEMSSLFVEFFLQINVEKIEAFSQCFLVNSAIQIYFKTALKPIFAQLRKSSKKEVLFQSLLDSLKKYSTLIPRFFIRLMKKSESRGLIFYKILKTFISFFDAFEIESPETGLYYRSQIKGLSKMARKYFSDGSFNDFILTNLIPPENMRKICGYVPRESLLKKIFPNLYRPFILVDKMSLSDLNLDSEYIYLYLKQSKEDLSTEKDKDDQNKELFEEMLEINKITKKSNFESNSIFILNTYNDFFTDFDSLDDETKSAPKGPQLPPEKEEAEFKKIAQKLYLKIASRFLSKANLVQINNISHSDSTDISEKTINLFKQIAELSSVFKDSDLEIEIDKLQIILQKYPMTVAELASLFEEEASNAAKKSDVTRSRRRTYDPNLEDEAEYKISDSDLTSLKNNPLYALTLYGKQHMMLTKNLVLLDDINKRAFESAVFQTVVDNAKFNLSGKTVENFISNPASFVDFYHAELDKLSKNSPISKMFNTKPSLPSPIYAPLTSLEAPSRSLLLFALHETSLFNIREYPKTVKKADKQAYKAFCDEEDRKRLLGMIDPDKSTKVFFDDPSKLQPFIDQLKIVFMPKGASKKSGNEDEEMADTEGSSISTSEGFSIDSRTSDSISFAYDSLSATNSIDPMNTTESRSLEGISTNPIQTIEPLNPASQANPLNQGDSLAPTTPINPLAPIDPLASTAPINPLAPIAPIDPLAPTAPINPLAPIDPLAPITPINPLAPIAPIDPLTSTSSIDPLSPTKSIDPLAPTTSIDPLAPTTSIDPLAPTAPVDPLAPIDSVGSYSPIDPIAQYNPNEFIDANPPASALPNSTSKPQFPFVPLPDSVNSTSIPKKIQFDSSILRTANARPTKRRFTSNDSMAPTHSHSSSHHRSSFNEKSGSSKHSGPRRRSFGKQTDSGDGSTTDMSSVEDSDFRSFHSESGSSMILLTALSENMDKAVKILIELLKESGSKENGMDQMLPLTVLGIIYASPQNLHSVLFFINSFISPVFDNENELAFTKEDKFCIRLLQSALIFFDKSNKE